nr:anaphase-promoting complex subunit Hcn1 [Polyrhizophydium stewartii]
MSYARYFPAPTVKRTFVQYNADESEPESAPNSGSSSDCEDAGTGSRGRLAVAVAAGVASGAGSGTGGIGGETADRSRAEPILFIVDQADSQAHGNGGQRYVASTGRPALASARSLPKIVTSSQDGLSLHAAIGDSNSCISASTTPSQGGLPAVPSELYSLLTTLPFFAGVSCTNDFLLEISKYMHVRKYSPGDSVVRQGETARAMFFIIKGSLRVISDDGEIDFGELSHGTFFGEIGILFDVKRTATVVAKTSCTLVTLMSEDVQQRLQMFPEIKEAMRRAAKERFEVMVRELERAGRKPTNEVMQKFLESPSLQEPVHLPVYSSVARRRSISTGLSEFATSEPSEYAAKESVLEVGINRDDAVAVCAQQQSNLHDSQHTPRASETSSAAQSAPISASTSSSGLQTQESDPTVMSSNALLSRRLNDKRRVSVAVWSDDRLMQFAQSIVSQGAGRESTSLRSAMHAQSHESLESGLEGSTQMSSTSCILDDAPYLGLGPAILVRALQYLDVRHLMRVRRINKSISTLIGDRTHNLLATVDLSPWHKRLDNAALASVVAFCGANVQTLILRNCWQITDQGLSRIAQHAPRLRALSLSSVWDITEAGLETLAEGCKQLRAIELSNCRKITDRGVLALLDRCPHLDAIGLSYCKNLSDAIMDRSVWGTVRRVNLQRCTGIFDGGFLRWRDAVPAYGLAALTDSPVVTFPGMRGVAPFALEELNLSDCSFLTDQAIACIGDRCPRLRRLCLSFCCSLTERFAEPLVLGCNELETLDASYCGSAVTDGSLQTLAAGLPQLRRLSIRGCVQVTDAGVDTVLQFAAHLEALNLTQCKQISADTAARAEAAGVELVASHGFFEDELVSSGVAGVARRIRAATASEALQKVMAQAAK